MSDTKVVGWSIRVTGTADEVRAAVKAAECHDHGGNADALKGSKAGMVAAKKAILEKVDAAPPGARISVWAHGPRGDLHPGVEPTIDVDYA